MSKHLLAVCLVLLPQFARAQPAVDPFGDPLPTGAIARLGTVRWRAESPIILAAMIQARSALTVNDAMLVQVWDLASGSEIHRFDISSKGGPLAGPLRRPSIRSLPTLAASRNGKRLASMDVDNVVHVWDVATGKELLNFGELRDQYDWLALSGDGEVVLTSSFMRGIEARRVTGSEKPTRIGDPPKMAAGGDIGSAYYLSHDGKSLLRVSNDISRESKRPLTIWDVTTGKESSRVTELPLRKNEFLPTDAVHCSPDLKTFAFVLGNRVVFTGSDGKEIGHAKGKVDWQRQRFLFAPDGKSFVALTGPNEPMQIWEVPSGRLLREFGKAPERGGFAINFPRLDENPVSVAPDGKSVLWCGGTAMSLIDLETGKIVNEGAGHAGPLAEVFFAANGAEVITRGSDPIVRRWDAKSGKVVDRLNAPPDAKSFLISPDARWFAAVDAQGGPNLFDAITLKSKYPLSSSTRGLPPALAFSPDSRWLAVAAPSRSVQLYDVATGEKRAKFQIGDPVPADDFPLQRFDIDSSLLVRLSFSPDSTLLAVASPRQVTLFDVARERQVLHIPLGEESLKHVAVSPDGRTVALEASNGTSIWEVATGSKRLTVHRDVTPPADPRNPFSRIERLMQSSEPQNSPLAFSPDGRLLARAAGQDRKTRVFDAWTGSEVGSFQGHRAELVAVAFAPEGRRLVTASADTTALVWDLTPVREKLLPIAMRMDDADAQAAWATLGEHDAARAHRAIRMLTGDPAAAVKFLRDHLKPAAGPDAQRLAKLIADLGNARFATREKAARELDRMGEAAVQALCEAQQSASTEVQRAAKKVLDSIAQQPPTHEQVRALRVIEVLERIATPESVEALKALAAGAADLTPTPQAKAALARVEANKKNAWPTK